MPSGHIDEEQLERYSMGVIPEPELAPLEEHLLLCERCREALTEMDEYVRAMRVAATRLRSEEKRPLWAFFPRGAWVGALAAAAMSIFAVALWYQPGTVLPVPVALESTRGGENAAFAPAPAGKVLKLSLDPGDLPVASTYRVDVVDDGGHRVWQGSASHTDNRLTVTGPQLRSGHYYVRLYSATGELLREYGVESN